MPEIMSLDRSINDPNLKIYNLTYAVGERCANKPEDVMLVQWLLMRHFERRDKKALLKGRFWECVNGVYGKNTADLIRLYQYDVIVNAARTRVEMTGQIFPVRQLSELDKYALVNLNMSVHSHFKNYFRNPQTDPILPWEAKNMLAKCGRIN